MQVKKYWLPSDNKTITNVLVIGKTGIPRNGGAFLQKNGSITFGIDNWIF